MAGVVIVNVLASASQAVLISWVVVPFLRVTVVLAVSTTFANFATNVSAAVASRDVIARAVASVTLTVVSVVLP